MDKQFYIFEWLPFTRQWNQLGNHWPNMEGVKAEIQSRRSRDKQPCTYHVVEINLPDPPAAITTEVAATLDPDVE